MKVPTPPIKESIALVDAAIATGQYNICPEQSKSEPDITNPQDNPDRKENIMKWNSKTFSFMLPDGAAIFCERLQGSDPTAPYGSDPVKYIEDWAEAEDETD